MSMQEVLILNPAPRRATRKRNPTAAQLRARAKFAAMARSRAKAARASNPKKRRARRRNPIATANLPFAMANPRRRRRSARRRNPITARAYTGRRRNPINIGGAFNVNAITGMLKDAAIQGAGAVAMDVGYSYLQQYLPDSLRAGPGQANIGAAVKAILTAVAGRALSKPTKGMSVIAAKGALTVQARDVVSGLLPAGVMAGPGRMGYASPARIFPGSPRIYPNRPNAATVGAYMRAPTPLLSAYMGSGNSPVLSGNPAREREGFRR